MDMGTLIIALCLIAKLVKLIITSYGVKLFRAIASR